MSGLIVQGYNYATAGFNTVESFPPLKFALMKIKAFNERIEKTDYKFYKDSLITLVIKPLTLAGEVQKFAYGEAAFKGIKQIAVYAGLAKSWLCMPDFLLNLPKCFSSFQTINPASFVDSSVRKFLSPTKHVEARIIKNSQNETVFKRLVNIASLISAFGENINLVKNYVKLPKLLERVTPWLQATALTYIGVNGIYEECQFRDQVKFADQQMLYKVYGRYTVPTEAHFSENYLSLATVAMNASYAFFGAIRLVDLYLGDNKKHYPELAKYQFIGACATHVMPIMKYCFERYRNSHWPKTA